MPTLLKQEAQTLLANNLTCNTNKTLHATVAEQIYKAKRKLKKTHVHSLKEISLGLSTDSTGSYMGITHYLILTQLHHL